MNTKIKILIAEHDPVDLELIHHELKAGGINYISEVVQNETDYINAIKNFIPDIILSDYSLPSFGGLTAFKIREERAPDTPFIIVSGTIGEERCVDLIKAGVTDYTMKEKLFTLTPKVKRALEECRERQFISKANLELIKSEKQYRQIVDTAQEGIWLIDDNNVTTFVNKKMADILGYSAAEMMGKQNYCFMDEEWKRKASEHIVSRKLGISENHDFKYITKQGNAVWTNLSTNPVFDDGGKYKGALAMVTDITESRSSAAKIKSSEQRYHTLFEQNLAGIYQSTLEGDILNCNDAFAKMLKYDSAKELLRINAFELYFSHTERSNFITALREQKKLSNYEVILKCKDGTPLHVLENISLRKDEDTGEEFCDGILIDITQRKKTAQEIEWLINNTEESFILLNRKLEITSFNAKARDLYSQYFKKELFQGTSILEYAQPERLIIVQEIYKKVLEGYEEKAEIVIPIRRGTSKNFELKYKPAKDEQGKIIGAFVSAIDITEKKKAEAQKEFERRDKEALINTTPDLIWSVDNDFKLIAANQAFIGSLKTFTGKTLQPGDQLLVKETFAPGYIEFWEELYIKSLSGQSFTKEIYTPAWGLHPEQWSETSFNPIYDGKTITGVACYSRDITVTKTTQRKIIEINKKLETAQQIAQLGYWELEMHDQTLYWSEEVYNIWNVSPATFEVNFKNYYATIHPDDRKIFDEAQKEALDKKGKLDIEQRIILASGDVKYIHEIGELIYDDQGKAIRFEGTVQDITGRKKAEGKIKESELRYRSLNEQATDAICITDSSFRFIDINQYACEMFGYSLEEALQLSLPDILFSEDLAANPIKVNELKMGKTIRNERRLKRKDGTAVSMEVSTKLMEDGTMIMFGHDITERKKAEEKIQKANRLYTFISQVNQHIVHIQDEAELFRNSCRIAFEFGKFKMAWIGITNKEDKKIKLVDQCGIPQGEINLFKNVAYQTNGPQDHVLSSGKYYVCNDIEHDNKLQSWSLFIKKNGIRSVIVLPIKKSGSIIGTFNLYAQELNFFDKEEIALLIDVVEDISFALDVFERAKKQKETEELILKNENLFRAMIEKSTDMKTLSTPEGKLLYGSASITKFLGYEVDELLDRSAFDLIHPEDAMTEKNIQELFAFPGHSLQLQQRMLHKNGNWVWCDGSITNMLNEPGVNALVSNFRDISEDKKRENQREFDSNNLNALINCTTDLMWSLDKNFRLITFNQPFFDVIKLVSGKELKKGDDVFSAALSPEQFSRFKISYTRAFSGDAFTETEHIASPVESWSEISYHPIREGNKVIGTACHSRNITERKKAEEKDQFQATLLNTIGQATIATDMEGKINFWNKAASKIYGWTEEEVIGKNIINITPAQQTQEQGEQIMQELLLGNAWSGEFIVRRKDGGEFPAFVTSAPIQDQEQRLIGIIGVSSDITNWKEAELRLKESNERYKGSEIRLNEMNANLQLQAKALAISNAELEQFAYVASHDLQEPLRMVTSFLTQLEKKYGNVIDAKGKKYIDFAMDGAKRMRQIILDLLEYSRVGTTEDGLESIDLNELIAEIQVLFRKQIAEKKATIIFDILPRVHAHRSPMRQVFQNLVGNALKYTQLNIAAKIQIITTELKTHWQFAVKDNGIGIGKEYFDKIFIIFQRLHNKDEFSGTGMGLAITKKIIENLGGRIWVESEEGKGSTFYFTILKTI